MLSAGVLALALAGAGRAAGSQPAHADTGAGVVDRAVVPTATGETSLAPFLSVLRDPGGKETFASVSDVSRAAGWQAVPAAGRIPGFGYTDDVLWLRARISAPASADRASAASASLPSSPPSAASAASRRWMLELASTRFDMIDWFVVENGRLVFTAAGGNLRPPSGNIPGAGNPRYPAIPLDLTPERSVDVYLRLHTEGSAFVPLTLLPYDAWVQAVERQAWRGGLFFGYIVAMAVLGFILASLTRNRGFLLCYTLVLACAGGLLFCAGGYYSWLGWPWASFWVRHGVLLWHGLAIPGFVMFLRQIFELSRSSPRLDRCARALMIVIAAWLPVMPFGPYRAQIIAVQGVEAISCLITLVVAGLRMREGVKSARWIFAGCLGLCVWNPLRFLEFLDFVPMHMSSEQVMQISTALACIFFLGAMADRIREIRHESALAAQREREAHEAMTRRLEQEVRDRTADLRKAKEKAEEASRFKTLFLANISHEIRAPLSTLVGLSQAMWMQSERYRLPEDFARFLNQIRTGGQYLNLMLTNLLDISASEEGRIPLHLQSLDLDAWTSSVRNLLEPLATNHNVRLVWLSEGDSGAGGAGSPPASRTIETDPLRLTQILLNIAHNAIKFTPPGGKVTIGLERTAGLLRLTVCDEGPGIPPGERESVFIAFRQTDIRAIASDGGVGLGLYVVRTNVDLLGGSVEIRGLSPCGTAFTVDLPAPAG
ncbi:signal transduction histidine kinase [Opitutaceae bacterium TAV1]|nr:signal transduction histidine kinase [Opitutaceae bacterium TAV1]